MFVIRDTFTAKPGQASKLASLFKEVMGKQGFQVRILTDAVGPYNTVMMEQEVPSLSDFEKRMKDYMDGKEGQEMRDRMKGYTDLYMSGKREIFRVM